MLVRISILPLNTVGQRRAGLMLFHSPSERRLRREGLLNESDGRVRERRAAFEREVRELAERNSYLAAFVDAEPNATNEELIGERVYGDAVTEGQNDFLADVSHDLRSLLGGLAVSAALLIADAPEGEDGDKIRKHAESSQRAVARMTRLISDLLDTASIEAGKLALIEQPVDVGRLVSDAVEAFTTMAAVKDIVLDAALPAPPLSATLDDLRILQVLENLLSNAIKFTPVGGKVSIRVRTTAHRIHFTVSDTGVGIPENRMAAVFERFHQVTKDRRGLGLGLHISRAIVEAHGGRIWVESEVAVGSTFHVELPIAPAGA